MQSKKPQTTHQNTTYKVAIEDKCAVLLQHCRTMYSNVEIDSHSLTQRALFSEVEPSLSRWKFSQQMLLLQGAEKWQHEVFDQCCGQLLALKAAGLLGGL